MAAESQRLIWADVESDGAESVEETEVTGLMGELASNSAHEAKMRRSRRKRKTKKCQAQPSASALHIENRSVVTWSDLLEPSKVSSSRSFEANSEASTAPPSPQPFAQKPIIASGAAAVQSMPILMFPALYTCTPYGVFEPMLGIQSTVLGGDDATAKQIVDAHGIQQVWTHAHSAA
eukprot:TRINITY_DN71251_c0_g1_i1.p1 TRINITY_DN71251_c0_g1~~TRINITY_DN71251_c0_g1_i1.p1  ORF type:complete len:177 (-),score=31.58 TRINITY_DN71251_c0_g1_i1:268-798(-)